VPRRLGDATWADLDGGAARLVLAVPLGSTEQHGPHLPLSTDTDIAVAVCERLAAARPHVVVAPPIAYGSSGEHAGFTGTLSIGQAAVELVIVELVRSADAFAGVVLVCAHGGNAEPVTRAVATLKTEGRRVVAWLPRDYDDAHAGRSETSIQLALDPTRVRVEAAQPGATEPLPELMGALRAGGVRSVSPNGVLGDPTGASVEEGRALLEALVDDLVACVDGLEP
jgi:creatinine amidohydrolase